MPPRLMPCVQSPISPTDHSSGQTYPSLRAASTLLLGQWHLVIAGIIMEHCSANLTHTLSDSLGSSCSGPWLSLCPPYWFSRARRLASRAIQGDVPAWSVYLHLQPGFPSHFCQSYYSTCPAPAPSSLPPLSLP